MSKYQSLVTTVYHLIKKINSKMDVSLLSLKHTPNQFFCLSVVLPECITLCYITLLAELHFTEGHC